MTDEYTPKFDRLGVERRVLGHVTDEDHLGRGPRNTLARLDQELIEDPHTSYAGNVEQLQRYVDDLVDAGLLAAREDGSYAVTDAGLFELTH